MVGRGFPAAAAAAARWRRQWWRDGATESRYQTRKGWFRGAIGGGRGDDGWPRSRAAKSTGVHGDICTHEADERPGGGVAGRKRRSLIHIPMSINGRKSGLFTGRIMSCGWDRARVTRNCRGSDRARVIRPMRFRTPPDSIRLDSRVS